MTINLAPVRHTTWALAAALSLTGVTWADEPPETAGKEQAVESILASWESVEARLTALLDELPEQAHPGIQRAIEANRQGRERALAALQSGNADNDSNMEMQSRLRAGQALDDAALRAEAGLDQARQHVPEHVLPRLDEAAARMRDGLARAAGAPTGRPEGLPLPAGRPELQRPERPTPESRPERPVRPAERPAGRPVIRPATRPEPPVRPQQRPQRPGG